MTPGQAGRIDRDVRDSAGARVAASRIQRVEPNALFEVDDAQGVVLPVLFEGGMIVTHPYVGVGSGVLNRSPGTWRSTPESRATTSSSLVADAVQLFPAQPRQRTSLTDYRSL